MPESLGDLIERLHADIPESAWDEVEYRQWLHEMYRTMDFLMRAGYWRVANAFLMEMQAEKPERAVAVLRFTSDAPRDQLVSWSTILRIVRANIIEQGGDADRMLRGLEPKST